MKTVNGPSALEFISQIHWLDPFKTVARVYIMYQTRLCVYSLYEGHLPLD